MLKQQLVSSYNANVSTGLEDVTQRATRINSLTSDERENLPTNNLNYERYLAKFGYLAAQSAAHSNKLFKAKRIRDDLVLSDAEDSLLVERSMSKMMKILDEMEISWSSKQKELKKERLFENIKKKVSLFLIYFISTVVIGT